MGCAIIRPVDRNISISDAMNRYNTVFLGRRTTNSIMTSKSFGLFVHIGDPSVANVELEVIKSYKGAAKSPVRLKGLEMGKLGLTNKWVPAHYFLTGISRGSSSIAFIPLPLQLKDEKDAIQFVEKHIAR